MYEGTTNGMAAYTSHGALAAEIVDLRKANAELLSALRELVRLHDRCGENSLVAGGEWQMMDGSKQLQAARAAIAHAEAQ